MKNRGIIPLILNNAKRLLSDAELLLQHRRFASALALAVLSLEEVGKIVFLRWQSDPDVQRDAKQLGLHKVKQAIVGALYLAQTARAAYDGFLTERGLTLATLATHGREIEEAVNELAVEIVAKAMYESKTGRLLNYSKAGVIDKTKQAALYVDEWFLDHEISPFGFKQSDAETFVTHAKGAIELLDDPMLRRIAKAVYDLSRPEKPVAA